MARKKSTTKKPETSSKLVKKSTTKRPKTCDKQKKKEIPVAPRLQLEPRLTPSPKKKIRDSKDQVNKNISGCYDDVRFSGNVSHEDDSRTTLGQKTLKVTVKKEPDELVASSSKTEHRFTPSTSKFGKFDQDHESENDSKYHEGNKFHGNDSQIESNHEDSSVVNHNEDIGRKFSAMGFSETGERRNHKIPYQQTQSSVKKSEPVIDRRRKGFRAFEWSDRERLDLAASVQAYGFSDIQKLADSVKTKTEAHVRQFMRGRRTACRKSSAKVINRQGDHFNTLRPDFIKSWPNIRKWRKLAHEQMLIYTRTKDYSKQVIPALCKKFYEEEEEPTDSQVINVKLIYKYIMDCMAGEIPPQLPPKESALVLDLLREVRSIPIAYDFEEERKFLQEFRSSTKFKPFHVKDEFKKKCNKETEPENVSTPNTVAVPEEVFLDLSRHKRLTQSFSPLVTPVWMLQKEQECLARHAAESNVYVD